MANVNELCHVLCQHLSIWYETLLSLLCTRWVRRMRYDGNRHGVEWMWLWMREGTQWEGVGAMRVGSSSLDRVLAS